MVPRHNTQGHSVKVSGRSSLTNDKHAEPPHDAQLSAYRWDRKRGSRPVPVPGRYKHTLFFSHNKVDSLRRDEFNETHSVPKDLNTLITTPNSGNRDLNERRTYRSTLSQGGIRGANTLRLYDRSGTPDKGLPKHLMANLEVY